MRFTVLSFFLLSLFSCKERKVFDAEKVSKIIYYFHDSSVPPPYHRSYTITVEENSGKVEVDSYGDLIAKDDFKLTDGEFANLINEINSADISGCNPKKPEPCSGATADSFEIYEGEKLVLDVYLDHCGDGEFPSSCGEIRSIIEKVKKYPSNLDALLAQ